MLMPAASSYIECLPVLQPTVLKHWYDSIAGKCEWCKRDMVCLFVC